MIKFFSIILFTIISTIVYSQNVFVMGKANTFRVSSGVFYDDGGKEGNVSYLPQLATFEAAEGLIEIYFTELDIAQDAEIRIYNGNSINDEQVAVFHKGDKIYNVKYPVITIQYIPSKNNYVGKGWKGIIIPNTTSKTAKIMVTAPESDCPNAIPICSNTTINTSANQYDNTGVINDDAGGCYSGTGSGGSVWYTFTPQSNGPLDFDITPLGSTDYDFVLWDITNGCSNKVELSCNFSGTTGSTGLSSAGSTNSEGSGGIVWNQKINVVTTKVYALCINYYSGTNGGFDLTFKNEAGSVNILDVTPPSILNAYTANCTSTTTLSINFSELVQCSTIQNSDFTIPGYAITVSNNFCNASNGTTQVLVTISPALTSGTYTMNAANILDMCGNNMNSNYIITLGVMPTPAISAASVVCKNPGFFGIGFVYSPSSQTLTGSGGTQYIWNSTVNSPSLSVSPTTTTVYTLTALQGACAATATRQVIVEQVTANAGPDQTICAGFPTVINGSGGGTYQWQSGTSASGPWTNISGATNSVLNVSPAATIWYRVLVTGPNGCINNDVIKITTGAGSFGITASKAFACQGENITLSLPSGITSYTWNTGTSANTPLVVAPPSTTSYTATSTTAGCAGSATISIPVRPVPIVTATVSPTNLACGSPLTLSGSPSSYTNTVSETFEGASQTLTLVNGAYNKWYQGTAAFCGGAKGLYIGTAATNNNYEIGDFFTNKGATNHAYKDFTVTSYCSASLSFNWKCGGNSSAYLRAWIVPTTVTPIAGTALTASPTNSLVGTYSVNTAACSTVTVDLTPYAGQSVRVVFTWVNSGGAFAPAVVPPAASIDNVVFTESSNFGYSWSSSPSGLSNTTTSVTIMPTIATSYSLLVTRCDGCTNIATTSVIDCFVLPVELISFSGNCLTYETKLEWTTGSEKENNYFIIQKSNDGASWHEISKTFSSGTSNSIKNYSYLDKEKNNELVYYRLIQVDNNQNFEVLKIISLDCKSKTPYINYFPNPVNNKLVLNISNGFLKDAKICIYNVLGQTIKEEIIKQELSLEGQYEIDFSLFANGVYNILFESNNFSDTQKIIKNN